VPPGPQNAWEDVEPERSAPTNAPWCWPCCMSPRFVDLAPAEVYATLIDEGQYLCSESNLTWATP